MQLLLLFPPLVVAPLAVDVDVVATANGAVVDDIVVDGTVAAGVVVLVAFVAAAAAGVDVATAVVIAASFAPLALVVDTAPFAVADFAAVDAGDVVHVVAFVDAVVVGVVVANVVDSAAAFAPLASVVILVFAFVAADVTGVAAANVAVANGAANVCS
jgi:hypothetical protein